MRLIAKFALTFFVLSFVALLAHGYLAARRELRDVEESVSSDLSSFGLGLDAVAKSAWRDGGPARVQAVLADVTRAVPELEVQWVPNATASTDSVVVDSTGAFRTVVSRTPVRVDGHVVGVIDLRRNLPASRETLLGALADELKVATALAVGGVLLAAALGSVLIGRPLQRVVEQARRIGAGDLSHRLSEDRRDELGDLKRELNAMCDQIAEARTNLETESTAHIETLEQLRHLDRLRIVGTIASSLAHELGTPLNVLLLRAQSLEAGEVLPTEIEDTGRAMALQVSKMSRLVRQMLDFSRREPEKGLIQLSSVCSRTANLLGAIAKKFNVDLTVEVVDEITVHGEASLLEQALSNLVLNGIQAMPRGGPLRLRIGHDATAQPARSERSTATAFVEIRDVGVGIEADALERIFEPFYTSKPSGQGTGLGLCVAHDIVKDHGGWIQTESRVGVGTTFTIHLPAVIS